MIDKDAFKKGLQTDLDDGRKAFEGQYAQALNDLQGLSPADLDAITPHGSDRVAFDALVALVIQASQRNLDQAELAAQIQSMGTTAVAIAKQTVTLAALFA
jgi:hypothetical protein